MPGSSAVKLQTRRAPTFVPPAPVLRTEPLPGDAAPAVTLSARTTPAQVASGN
jgi:hypothetical protein